MFNPLVCRVLPSAAGAATAAALLLDRRPAQQTDCGCPQWPLAPVRSVRCETLRENRQQTDARSPNLDRHDSLLAKERAKVLSALEHYPSERNIQRGRSYTSKRQPSFAQLGASTSLRVLFEDALPEKSDFFEEWVSVLSHPTLCIYNVGDVQRLHSDDISGLPVPPVVKSLFRQVCELASFRKAQLEEVALQSAARQKEFLGQQRDTHGEPFHAMAKASYFQDVSNYRLILTQEEIATGVKICASRIERWCQHDRIVVVGVLTGAFVFVADLCRALSRPYSVQFVKASSYQAGKNQGDLVMSKDVNPKHFVTDCGSPKKIILVDELLDNGKTLELLRQHFLDVLKDTHKESDIITCVLFTKKRERKWPEADICGIPNLPDLWGVGYGLDDRGGKRGWTELFATPKVRIVNTINRVDTDALLECLDENGTLVKTLKIGSTEITHKAPQFKVTAVDGVQVRGKSHLRSLLDHIPQPLKGKYEHELRFSFAAEGIPLIHEDEIFQGNELAYAEMRRTLKDQIAADAAAAGVM